MDSIVYQVAIGLGLALVGILLFILAINAGKYRKTWAFWFACIYGGCLLLIFPDGLPFGIFLLVYALSKRNEFLSPRISSAVLTK
jgi:hypothetical protein